MPGNVEPLDPPSGVYEPQRLLKMFYGQHCVQKNLVACLPDTTGSRAIIITGPTLANKTPLVKEVEALLGADRHTATFAGIRQHAPVDSVAAAVELATSHTQIDVVISIGGGSVIDAAKTVSFRFHEAHGRYLTHVAIPTTLSASECTDVGGTTMHDGVKKGVRHPSLAPQYILYDAAFARHTPPTLFLSTGLRALDHAMELQYHPAATALPCRAVARAAIATFADRLPQYRRDPTDADTILALFLAAYSSIGLFGNQMTGALGLSHSLGYALGSPYGIPHGVTSCLTLSHVVALKARQSPQDARRIAATLPCFGPGARRSGDDTADAADVARRIRNLVDELGLATTLTHYGVPRDQLDTICDRALGSWMPGETRAEADVALREAVRELVRQLF
ncbi:hypothetical protein SEUCBS140593_010352 [Sporothrix eucalyptigena]|uniref:Alcohol dehydrogenase iron-type/glycerol dehydrogenase GldA domain-containing protein n=1 Tax=Sporothrix eucalyptigena TaxID=1812306 RepID=A0ABP0D3S2_9PEZI